jgi:predicted Zn-dependent protease
MTDTNGSEDWRVLCKQASKEKDPEKLIDLIMQINQALEESDQKSRYHANANGYSHSDAPQFSRSPDCDG